MRFSSRKATEVHSLAHSIIAWQRTASNKYRHNDSVLVCRPTQQPRTRHQTSRPLQQA